MLASPTSRWSAGTVLLTLLVLVASWFLLIGPRRADASAVRDEVASQQNQAGVLQMQIAQLKSQFSTLPARRAELAAIKRQLPAAADIPALVRSLQDYAAASGVSLESLAPGTPAIYGDTTTAAGSGAGSAGQVVTIPIALTVSGDYFEDALFLKALQVKLSRAVLITGLSASQSTAAAAVADPTATPAPDPSSTSGTVQATQPAVAPTAAPVVTTTLQITGSVFVLLDDTTTLKDVADQARKGAASTGVSATPAALGVVGTAAAVAATSAT